jgi:hypothetical protein
MGYFKTLMIDPSAAREYSQRWAQSDQVEEHDLSHLVSGHGMFRSMTTTTVAQPVNITREHVGRALYSWRKNVEHNPRDLNAVNRAALNLEACPWYMTPIGELVITSATTSRTRYHVTLDGCDCRAAMSGRACWHVAAYKLLHTADAMRRLQASQKTAQGITDDVQILVDELV